MQAREVVAILKSGRYPLSQETQAQAGIEEHLKARLPVGVALQREPRLTPKDRPDFLVGGAVVIEVKVNRATARDTIRQLERYAALDQVTDLILATNRAMPLPAAIGGKPVFVVHLGRAWL